MSVNCATKVPVSGIEKQEADFSYTERENVKNEINSFRLIFDRESMSKTEEERQALKQAKLSWKQHNK